jgi:hypothetical protein
VYCLLYFAFSNAFLSDFPVAKYLVITQNGNVLLFSNKKMVFVTLTQKSVSFRFEFRYFLAVIDRAGPYFAFTHSNVSRKTNRFVSISKLIENQA